MVATTHTHGHLPDSATHGITLDHPWRWLAAGWRDFRRHPGLSLAYGLLFVLAGIGLVAGLWSMQLAYLVIPLTTGFLLVGPVVAVGLYAMSRADERGEPIGLVQALGAFRSNPTQIPMVGVMLVVIQLFWLLLTNFLVAAFFSRTGIGGDVEALWTIFFSPEHVDFLFAFVALGGAIALLVFATCVVSVPMLLDRPIDVATAVVTSVQVTRANPAPLLLWAAIIAGCIALGMATLLIGLAVALPIIGHATWHAYRDLVEPAD